MEKNRTAILSICLLAAFQHGQAQSLYANPVLNMRDGCIERFGGYYYALGGETFGKIYQSKDMVSWSNGVLAVGTDQATWLNDPQWTQASTYKRVGAGDIVYRNGVWHTYYNGIGHSFCSLPQGTYQEQCINAPFDDYGIDVQLFQDEDGQIYWVKKRNQTDPHPLTGAASNIDGPEVWTFRMNSPFSRWDITEGGMQLSHQRGHPTSLNHINFEGPELARYRDRYYLFYAVNRMGPRSGMYQIGCAQSEAPMNFDNSRKYPQPILTRNTEDQLLRYVPLAPTAEHGGWQGRYTFTTPAGDWTAPGYDDSAWQEGLGGFGAQQYDYYNDVVFTNAMIRARKTEWKGTQLYVRRTFVLDKVPEKVQMKYWVNGSATFCINGHELEYAAADNTYSSLSIDPSWLNEGENVVAVACTSSNTSDTSQQFLDFGFYDTCGEEPEDIMIGPAQPNFIAGPNGFERWMVYKAFINGKERQSIDRLHFFGDEPVSEATVKNSQGFHPAPALPGFMNYLDYAIYYPFEFLDGSEWQIAGKVMTAKKESGGALLLRAPLATDYRLELNIRLKEESDRAAVYACYEDEDNWLKIEVARNGYWYMTDCADGNCETHEYQLPDQFAFLENHELVDGYESPWHALTIYKNGGRFSCYLDAFCLTPGGVETMHTGQGKVGWEANSNTVDFDAVQLTQGWDEYDDNITGWDYEGGAWKVEGGLKQQSADGDRVRAVKGDAMWNYEFSTYMTMDDVPASGKAGFYPLYIDEDNYVSALIDYSSRMLEIEAMENGNVLTRQQLPLNKKVMRQYDFTPTTAYPSNSYVYRLRNEAVVSGIDILWLEGEYPYLSQKFALPSKVSVFVEQDGSWKMVTATLEGQSGLGVMNHYAFDPVKTTAIRLYLQSASGYSARPFTVYVNEDLSAGYYLRARREADGVHVFIDNEQMALVEGNWGKSRPGLLTEGVAANYNGLLCYQSGWVKVTGIELEPADCEVGGQTQLQANVLPEQATWKTLHWESSNPEIVTVDDKGVMKRLAPGKVVITAYTTDGQYVKASMETGGEDTAIEQTELNREETPTRTWHIPFSGHTLTIEKKNNGSDTVTTKRYEK
ncbi:MAG: family 43 glycosylhydrolase [Prevotella sp.]